MEQLIFNTWKVGEVIEFPDVEVKYRCNFWADNQSYSETSFDYRKFEVLKSDLFKNVEHLYINSDVRCNQFMIPKSELIRIGMLKETKEEMKSKELTLERAKHIYNYTSIESMKVWLEELFPELKPKLITDEVKTVEDADRYMGSDIFSIEGWKSYAKVERLAHVLNEEWEADSNDRDQCKWYVYYDVGTKEFSTNFDLSHMSGKVYFESEDKAIHAYNHNLQLFKDLFKVKG